MSDDDPDLAKAARAIVSGNAADWGALASSVGDETRPILDELRVIGAISDFHQQLLDPADVSAIPSPIAPSVDTPEAMGQWGALTLIEEIGRGAFSHVYRARDPKIDREVALKLLDRQAASETPSGLAIVEEGRLLARVRHPNIVTIHGADAIDGRVGIEMELIDGQTLEEIVQTQGPLGPDEVMVIARAICRALAAVHRTQLVHRDVKAANVMREHGGRIVLMDLGAGSDAARAREGSLIGTPLYLAPEILGGAAASPLSDIYGLGVLLFFLATGTYPWAAGSIEELRAAHAAGRCSRLRDHRPDLPERFIHVVERALAPDPNDRFHSAGDFEAVLSETLERPDPHATGHPRQIGWKTAVAGIVVIATLVGVAVWAIWPRPELPAAAQRFIVALEERLSMPSAPGAAEFALSSDGSRLVYSISSPNRASQLRIRELGRFDTTLFEGTGDSGQPFFSPDGRFAGYHRMFPPFGKLAVKSLDGGPETTLTEWRRPAGASWAGDGTIVYSASDDLWRISARGGTPVQLTHTSREKDESAIRPQVLDDGSVLFTLRSREQRPRLAVLTSAGTIKPILDDAANGKFLPPGYLVFVRGTWIMAAPFNVRRVEVTGSPVELVTQQSGWFDVSRSGSLIYSAPETSAAVPTSAQFVWIDRRTGHESPVSLPRSDQAYIPATVRLSPDGRQIAVAVATTAAEGVNEETRGRIWIGDLTSGTLTPLTEHVAQPLAWTPDGLFVTYVNAAGAIAWVRADGGRSEEVLAPAAAGPFDRCTRGAWSPNGQTLVAECAGDLIGLTLPPIGTPRARPTVTPVVDSPYTEGAPSFSPDGRWLAYQSNQSGQMQVYVRAFPGPTPALPLPTRVAHDPLWRRGGELFYISQGLPFGARVTTEPGFRVIGEPRAILDRFPYDNGSAGVGRVEVSPDGQRFLVMKGIGLGAPQALTRLHLVLHWVEEVKRKVAPAR